MNRWLGKMHQAQQTKPTVTPQPIAPTPSDPALDRLRSLYAAGRLRSMRLELPGRPPIYDLQAHLSRLHGLTLSDADRAELGEIAALVSRLPFLGVN